MKMIQTLKSLFHALSPWFVARLIFTELAGLVMMILCLTWQITYRGGFGSWSLAPAYTLFNYHGFFMLTGFVFIYGHGNKHNILVVP
jgi:hypothetical protein